MNPDQLARIEDNRAKARERLAARASEKAREAARQAAEQAAAASAGVSVAGGQKPTLNSVRDASAATGTKRPYDDIRPAKKFTNYIEYDLAKIRDTKGGYMAEENAPEGMSLEEWQKKNKPVFEQPRALNPEDNPTCFECGTFDLDYELFKTFGCRVCKACRNEKPEKYSLLTKTECREDYLLTDPELRDVELLPHMERPNPHKMTYNNMMLYLRYQVEEFAMKKWGGEEGLDKEYERRMILKKEKKDKKFAEKLKQMRKRTRTETWNKKMNETEHRHVWGAQLQSADSDVVVRMCEECGMETEELLF
ncbi:XPA protein C-terminus-domain-containing protein [Limtongia smithiae]|uniref:XPA protein C-terminus-domain-containing protein n=1 Tax=Limtongia smithiae TaxID=1125753 RepID=UPI0034CD4AA8